MKHLLFFLCTLFVLQPGFSQQHSKSELISLLNEKCKEMKGIVKILGSERSVVSDASFTETANGVSFKMVTDARMYTMDFNPRFISVIEDANNSKTSPIGIMRLKLGDDVDEEDFWQLCRVYTKQNGSDGILYYSKKVSFDFFQVDPDNFKIIEKYLVELKNIYDKEANPYEDEYFNAIGLKFWMSDNGVSKSYNFHQMFMDKCNLYLFYSLQTTAVSGDSKKNYLTIVPLKKIDLMNIERTSYPKGMVLNTLSGFERFEQDSDGDYSYSGTDRMVPAFLPTTDDAAYEKIRVLLKKMNNGCGGRL